MTYRTLTRTRLASAFILFGSAITSNAACSATNEAASDTTTGEVERLEFAWKANVKIDVDTRRGRIRKGSESEPQRTGLGFQYLLATNSRDEGLLVTFSELKTDAGTPINGENSAIETVVQFAGLVPDFVVSSKGEFLGVENLAAKSQLMKQLVSSAIPSMQDSPVLAQALEFVSSKEFLEANAVKQWDGLVGFWIGENLQIGKTYSGKASAPHPFIPGVQVDLLVTYGATRRLPCSKESRDPQCVELFLTSEIDGKQIEELARKFAEMAGDDEEARKVDALRIAVLKEEVRLVTEPRTLMPHQFEFRKTIEAHKRPDAIDRESVVDYQESTYRYR